MKIGEAKQIYSARFEEFWDQKLSLAKKKKALDEKINTTPNGKEVFSHEAVTLDLSYNAVSEKCEEYSNFLEQVMLTRSGLYNAEVAKQQGDIMSECARDTAKIMEVARRISRGGKVPAEDEKKLMEFSMVMYMSAKNAAMMNELKEKKQYTSLWDEEKGTEENPDPNEVADNGELTLDAPDAVDVSSVIASAVSDDESE
ncbi:hypothetical protein [Anaerocolumna sp. MB42-C2]|uniref:hypothetical protein n=1 Tax=Anaerocolumna sp. MB42-C2 TaxID=3070997 RepID=UPI0027DF3233|nr:hypothetical protein [Anaerocolumna sp. MB42-C2]WMJ86050.1 hypothetical protein RBU59_18675 [Anaerocolumna sp. MB42-C2]